MYICTCIRVPGTVDQFWLSVYIYIFASFTGGTARFFYFSGNSGQLFDASGALHGSLAEPNKMHGLLGATPTRVEPGGGPRGCGAAVPTTAVKLL